MCPSQSGDDLITDQHRRHPDSREPQFGDQASRVATQRLADHQRRLRLKPTQFAPNLIGHPSWELIGSHFTHGLDVPPAHRDWLRITTHRCHHREEQLRHIGPEVSPRKHDNRPPRRHGHIVADSRRARTGRSSPLSGSHPGQGCSPSSSSELSLIAASSSTASSSMSKPPPGAATAPVHPGSAPRCSAERSALVDLDRYAVGVGDCDVGGLCLGLLGHVIAQSAHPGHEFV